MMPYSDLVPPFVIPYCDGGKRYVDTDVRDTVAFEWCYEYRPHKAQVEANHDIYVPLDFKPCRARNGSGVRNHNWCYRCPAGFMYVEMHIYDAERESDRAVRIV